jgi:hypothetical protein
MALPEKVHELDERIAATVQGALGGLRKEIRTRLDQSASAIEETLASAAAGLPKSFVAREDVEPLAQEARRVGRATATATLRNSFAAFDQAASQAEILSALLVEAGRFASRTAVFLARPDSALGWGAYGFEEPGQLLSQVSVPWSDGGAWERLAEGRGTVLLAAADCARLASRLESPIAHEAVLVPLVLADRVAAALYADRLAQAEPLDLPALQALVYVAGQSLELLALRSRPATPTLLEAGQGTGPEVALALWSPEEPPEAPEAGAGPAPPPEVDLFPEPALAPIAAETAPPGEEAVPAARRSWEETAAELFGAAAPAPAVEPAWAPAAPVEEAGEPAAAFEEPPPRAWEEAAEPSGGAFAAAEPAATWEEAVPEPPPSWPEPAAETLVPEPPALEVYEAGYAEEAPPLAAPPAPPEEAIPPVRTGGAATAEMAFPRFDASEDATLLTRRPAPTPAPPPLPAAAPAEEDATHPGGAAATRALPRLGTSPEVTPPSDFFGPGLAFAGRRAAGGEDALHEEARRLARLLVSEIRLYNEELVEDGRRNRDIYARLKDEIDRSRKMYEERIAQDVRLSRDYFTEELVRRLADGDAGALGM